MPEAGLHEMYTTVFAYVSGAPAPTTYLVLGGVLVALVFLTLWREAAATSGAQFFSRTLAALAFGTSRVTVVVFTGAMTAATGGPPLLYVLLTMLPLLLPPFLQN